MRVRVYIKGEQSGRPDVKKWDWGKRKWVVYARSRFVKLHNGYFYGGKYPYIEGELNGISDWPNKVNCSCSGIMGDDATGYKYKLYNKVLDHSLDLDTNGFYYSDGTKFIKIEFAKDVVIDNGIIAATN